MRFGYQKDKSYPTTVSLQIDHRWFIIDRFQRLESNGSIEIFPIFVQNISAQKVMVYLNFILEAV